MFNNIHNVFYFSFPFERNKKVKYSKMHAVKRELKAINEQQSYAVKRKMKWNEMSTMSTKS